MDERLEEFLERGVTALEKLAEEPILNIEATPSRCTNCGKIDPFVKIQNEDTEGSGKLSEFFLVLQCQECNKSFYAAPAGWFCYQSSAEMLSDLEEAGRKNV